METGPFLLQMAGVPGAGKSSIANAVAPRFGAAVLDMDLIKSAALDHGLDFEMSGRLAYELMFSLARASLLRGQPAILDSPCFGSWILERGQVLAAETHCCYVFAESVLTDLEEISRRPRSRPTMRSQRPDMGTAPVDRGSAAIDGQQQFERWLVGTVRPPSGVIALDARRPVEASARDLEAFVRAQVQSHGEAHS